MSIDKVLQDKNNEEVQAFQYKEAMWLDSIVRPFIPRIVVWFMEKLIRIPRLGFLHRFFSVIIDLVYIDKILKIKVSRSRRFENFSGKGFRPGHGINKVTRITTRVMKRGKEFAKHEFPVSIIT